MVEKFRRSIEFAEAECAEVQRFKRDAFGTVLSSSQISNVFKYRTNGRFSLLFNNHTGSTSDTEHYLAIIALSNSTSFYLNYIQYQPVQQSTLTFLVTATLFVFVSLLIITGVRTVLFIRDQLHRASMKRLQRRRAYRPYHSIQLLLHPKRPLHQNAKDKENIYYISNEDRKKRLKKTKYCVHEVTTGSITVQPTADLSADICSVIVQGPSSRSNRYTLFAGIALVHSATSDSTQTRTHLTKSTISDNNTQINLQELSEHESEL